MKTVIPIAKLLIVISLMILLGTTYTLRSRIITLINHELAAGEVAENERRARFDEAKPDRATEFDASVARFKKDMERYLDAVKKAAGKEPEKEPEKQLSPEERYRQSQAYQNQNQAPIPPKPEMGMSPQTRERLAAINAQFRADQRAYFDLATRLNWLVGICAMVLVGSLLIVIMFDPTGPRAAYVVVLALSFVFIIGPALYTSLTAIAWRMEPPRYDTPTYPRGY